MIQSKSAVFRIGTAALGADYTTATVSPTFTACTENEGSCTGPLPITVGNSSNPCLRKHTCCPPKKNQIYCSTPLHHKEAPQSLRQVMGLFPGNE